MVPSGQSWVFILAALALSCQCGSSRISEAAPDIRVSPLALDFGRVPVGLTVGLPIEVKNAGRADLVLEPPEVEGSDFAAPAAGFTVDPAGEASVEIAFTPSLPGERSGLVRLRSNSKVPEVEVPTVGIGMPRVVCGDCSTPPARYCASPKVLIDYEPIGVCLDDRCQYNAFAVACAGQCLAAIQQCGDAADAGAQDAGARDAGVQDAGARDAGAPDAGSSDGGSRDGGAGDAGTCTRSAVLGAQVQCPGATGQTYSISTSSPGPYAWSVPSGWSITSGQGTSSITVAVGQSGQNGVISVADSTGCILGTLNVSSKAVSGIRTGVGFYGFQTGDYTNVAITFTPAPVTTTRFPSCAPGCSCGGSGNTFQVNAAGTCLGVSVYGADFTFATYPTSASITIVGTGTHLYYPRFSWLYSDGTTSPFEITTCNNPGYIYGTWNVTYACTFAAAPVCP